MKTLLLTSSLILIVFSSFVSLTLYYNLNYNDTLHTQDSLKINSVNSTNLDYRCFTTPCFFSLIEINFTITNSVERTFNFSGSSLYSLHIIPDSSHSEYFYQTHNYYSQNTTSDTMKTLPVDRWNENYTALLSLSRMPTADDKISNIIHVQLWLGNGIIKSSVFSLNLESISQ